MLLRVLTRPISWSRSVFRPLGFCRRRRRLDSRHALSCLQFTRFFMHADLRHDLFAGHFATPAAFAAVATRLRRLAAH